MGARSSSDLLLLTGILTSLCLAQPQLVAPCSPVVLYSCQGIILSLQQTAFCWHLAVEHMPEIHVNHKEMVPTTEYIKLKEKAISIVTTYGRSDGDFPDLPPVVLILNYLYSEFSFSGLLGMLPVNLHVNMWEKREVFYVVPKRLRLYVCIHR